MTEIKEMGNVQLWGCDGAVEEQLFPYQVGGIINQLHNIWMTTWQNLSKLKLRMSFNTDHPCLEIYLRNIQIQIVVTWENTLIVIRD